MQAAPIKTLRWSQGRAGFPAASPTSAASSSSSQALLPAPAPWPSLSTPRFRLPPSLSRGASVQRLGLSVCGQPTYVLAAWPGQGLGLHRASAQSPALLSAVSGLGLPDSAEEGSPSQLLFPSCWDLAQACRAGLGRGLCLPLSQASFLTKIRLGAGSPGTP